MTRREEESRCPRRFSHSPSNCITSTTPRYNRHNPTHRASDASDVRKIKNALPQPEPDTPYCPTCTNRKDPTLKHKGITKHAKLQRRLPASTKLKTTSPIEASHNSERQQHAEQPLAPLGDRVPMSRKRQHS
jgi:hypothetical protein